MQYASEVFERIKATKDATDYRAVGADLARRWIAECGTFAEIKAIGGHYGAPASASQWIRGQCPNQSRNPDIYYGFCAEVRRFWDQHKNDL